MIDRLQTLASILLWLAGAALAFAACLFLWHPYVYIPTLISALALIAYFALRLKFQK